MIADDSSLHPLLRQAAPWKHNANPIWLASSVKFLRNLQGIFFPHKLSSEERGNTSQAISKSLLACKLLEKPTFHPAETLGSLEKNFLYEHFLAAESFMQAHGGEGFLTEASGTFLATLNLRDHVHLELLDTSGELETVWDRLTRIEMELSTSLFFAFSPKFGFMTSLPRHAGTGLVATIFLHIPAIIHMGLLDEALDMQGYPWIRATGLQGSANEFIGDILALHNDLSLGLTEEEILSALRELGTRITILEKGAQARLKKQESTAVRTKVHRAYGLLKYAYELRTEEALSAVSLLKLALNIGWVEGPKPEEVNALFLTSRYAHLCGALSKRLSVEETPRERGRYLASILEKASLK